MNIDSKNSSTYEFIDKTVKLFKQQPQWIPVSERLPEKNGSYLAYIVTCEYNIDSYWKWYPDDGCISDNVVAWMHLPETYKEESEG